MVYYMFNKPAGCITANRDEEHQTVMDYLQDVYVDGLHAVGRLDKDTEGLLLITDDGKWTQEILHPDRKVPKTYFFWSMGEVDEEKIQKIRDGVELRGGAALPAELVPDTVAKLEDIRDIVRNISVENQLEQPVYSGYLTVCEGRKHQVKRMIRAIGGYVVYLKRVSIGNLKLDDSLAIGKYRKLTKKELESINL